MVEHFPQILASEEKPHTLVMILLFFVLSSIPYAVALYTSLLVRS